MGKLIGGGVVGGAIVFIWGMISWMGLPWHMNSLSQFKSELIVERMILANAPEKGVYVFPLYKGKDSERKKESHARAEKGPFIFAAVSPDGSDKMPVPMMRGLLVNILSAIFMMWLLSQTNIQTFVGRVAFVKVVAFTGGILCLVPLWNWWAFPPSFIVLEMLDLLIAWGLAGAWMAKITAPKA